MGRRLPKITTRADRHVAIFASYTMPAVLCRTWLLATCLLHRRYAFLHGARQRLIRGVIDALVERAPPDLLVHRFICLVELCFPCVHQSVRATQERAERAKMWLV